MSTFTDAFGRGVDQTQAMGYAFAKTIGDLTGFDALSEWGEDGVQSNLAEIASNPPRVESFDDIHNLSDLGDYVIEAIGENAPTLLSLFIPGAGAAVGSAAVAGRAAVSQVAKAALGKAVKQRIPQEAYQTFVRERAKRIAVDALQAGATATKIGAPAVGVAINTGETQMQFDERGIENPAGALATGALKGALDVIGLQRIVQAARTVGVAPSSLFEVAGNVVKEAGLTGSVEAATEGLQTTLDLLAVKANDPTFDLFSVENLKEIREAALKGGIAGGTFGGAVNTIVQMDEYRKHRDSSFNLLDSFHQTVDSFKAGQRDAAPTVDFDDSATSEPVPEPRSDIDAQYAAMLDPSSSKRATLVTPGTPWPTEVERAMAGANREESPGHTVLESGDHIFSMPLEGGNYNQLITRDEELISELSGADLSQVSEGSLGAILFDRPEGKQGTDGTVVVAEDAQGAPVAEIVSSPETLERDLETAAAQAPEGGRVRQTTAEERINARIGRHMEEQGVADAPKVTEFIRRMPVAFQRQALSAMRGGSSQARNVASQLTIAASLKPEQQDALISQMQRQVDEDIAADEQQMRGFLGLEPVTEAELGDQEEQGLSVLEDDVEIDRPTRYNRGRQGWKSQEAAENALAKFEAERPADANASRRIAQDGDTFWVQEERGTDPAILPEQTGTTTEVYRSGKKLRRRRVENVSESGIVNRAIEASMEYGKLRPRLVAGLQKRGKEGAARRAQASIVNVVSPEGETIPMTTMELTRGGMDLLTARGNKRTIGDNEYNLLGFTTMLAELHQRGYDVTDAYGGQASAPSPNPEATESLPVPGTEQLRPELLLKYSNIAGGDTASDLTVGAATPRQPNLNDPARRAREAEYQERLDADTLPESQVVERDADRRRQRQLMDNATNELLETDIDAEQEQVNERRRARETQEPTASMEDGLAMDDLSTAERYNREAEYGRAARQTKATKRRHEARQRPADMPRATAEPFAATLTPEKGKEKITVSFPEEPVSDFVSRRQLFAARDKLKAAFRKGLDATVGRKLFTNDGRLRAIPGGEPIADLIYQQSNTRRDASERSFHDGREWAVRKWQGYLNRILEPHMSNETAVRRAFDELAREVPTDQLKSTLARDLREFLRRYYNEYLKARLQDIEFVEYYFPRSYDVMNITDRPHRFRNILVEHGIEDKVADAVTKSITRPQLLDLSEAGLTEFQQRWMRDRVFKDYPEMIVQLVDEGFLNTNPFEGFMRYIHQSTTRAEWERVFGGEVTNKAGGTRWSPNGKLITFLENVPKDRRAEAVSLVQSSVFPKHLDPTNKWHNVIGELKAYESWRVLMMSGVASVPEVTGVMLRAKGGIPAKELAKVVGDSIKNRQDTFEFAEAFGVLRNVIGASLSTEIHVDPTIGRKGVFRRSLPHLFKYNLNDTVTNWSRMVGLQVGRTFIARQAQNVETGVEVERSRRYLQELGLSDHKVVLRWRDAGMPAWSHLLEGQQATDADAVGAALSQFLDESIVNPNSSERPSWAEHPVGGLAWHLKQFAMSYNKRILAGGLREISNRAEEGGAMALADFTPYVVGTIGMFLAMGALSDELRNRLLTLGEEGTVAANRGDAGDMVTKWADRAGFMSLPFATAFVGAPAGVNAETAAFAAGPTAHHFYELLFEMAPSPTAMEALKNIPGLSQAPELRREILDLAA